MFRTIYWTFRRVVWDRITHIPYGIRNVIRWTPVIWNDADFDWEFLAEIMEYKLRRMSRHFHEHGFVERADEMAAECLEAAELLHAMRESNGTMYELSEETCGYHALSDDEHGFLWKMVHGEEWRRRYRFGNLMAKIEWWWD